MTKKEGFDVQDAEAGIYARDQGTGGGAREEWVAQSAGAKVITPEQVELLRLRVENAKLRMGCEIQKSDGVLSERCAMKYAP